MGIASSLYSSISGLNTMGNSMGVLGDNVANVNTIAFKSSRATFQDVLSQSVSTAAGSAQVGRGVTLSTVDGLFAQGSFESTSTATDLAIGGQGFFMLRASENSSADMYSRAGEFRFDQQGNLVNPVGYFVQGWSINSETGESQGTIGDINLGKSTPPVSSTGIEIIVNLDSREPNETNEQRLYDAWDGTNAAAVNPSEPIDSSNYEYTSAIKVYDSKGASHDLTVYFDRTTNDNEWEFLVTCEPSEDLRYLSSQEQIVYAPNDTFNYEEHRGAGALMYGVINFTTAGDINKISAWKVPPDGQVDISQDDNRLFLSPTDRYYSFEANFTGASTNQAIEINLGAVYGGSSNPQYQVLVSDAGAFDSLGMSDPITKETLWSSVYDRSANLMSNGDTFFITGYNHDGVEKSFRYTVDATQKVGDFLTKLGAAFGGSATIDGEGRLRLSDNSGGSSGMYIDSMSLASANGANPFGTGSTVANMWSITSGKFVASDGTTPIANTSTLLTDVYDSNQKRFVIGDVLTFDGLDTAGAAVGPSSYTVTSTTTVQSLLNFLSSTYSATAGDANAYLNSDGSLRVIDNTLGGLLAPSFTSNVGTTSLPFGASPSTYVDTNTTPAMTDGSTTLPATGASLLTNLQDGGGDYLAPGDILTFTGSDTAGVAVGPFDYTVTDGATLNDLISFMDSIYDTGGLLNLTVVGGGINIDDIQGVPNVSITIATTPVAEANPVGVFSKQDLQTGQIDISSAKTSIVSPGRALTTDSGEPPVVTAGSTWNTVYADPNVAGPASSGNIKLKGYRGDGTYVEVDYTIAPTETIQDLLDAIEDKFEADATIDDSGRLVLRDWAAESTYGSAGSQLQVTDIDYTGLDAIFGPTDIAFERIIGSSQEDGSKVGGTVSTIFETEALASTQYANASTTIFQDQNGYAAGFLQSVSVDTDGVITGHYSNGQVLEKAQVALASFNNLAGLKKEGGNIFRETTDSGAPVTGAPGSNGLGSIAPNALEQSNVDLGNEFVKLITTQRGFQANSKIITTTDEMLADLINIKR